MAKLLTVLQGKNPPNNAHTRIWKIEITMPIHSVIGFAKGRAGFASWWSAVRVGRVGTSGESMSHAIHKVVSPHDD